MDNTKKQTFPSQFFKENALCSRYNINCNSKQMKKAEVYIARKQMAHLID